MLLDSLSSLTCQHTHLADGNEILHGLKVTILCCINQVVDLRDVCCWRPASRRSGGCGGCTRWRHLHLHVTQALSNLCKDLRHAVNNE